MENQPPPGTPIEISIAYGWNEHDHGENKEGLNDHWDFLKGLANSVAKQLITESKIRTNAEHKLQIRISRLRARHGAGVLQSIKKRIERSDVLIFDISECNPNVLFELGYAMANKGSHCENIFVLTNKTKTPSDLSLFMRTEYSLTDKKNSKKRKEAFGKLKDIKGFRSALLSSLKETARDRSMWGASRFEVECDEEEER